MPSLKNMLPEGDALEQLVLLKQIPRHDVLRLAAVLASLEKTLPAVTAVAEKESLTDEERRFVRQYATFIRQRLVRWRDELELVPELMKDESLFRGKGTVTGMQMAGRLECRTAIEESGGFADGTVHSVADF